MSMSRVFVAYEEGGEFHASFLRIAFRPKYIVQEFKGSGLIILFKCGMIFDDNLRRHGHSPWRHKLTGGRRGGKKGYKLVDKHLQEEHDALHKEWMKDLREEFTE